MEPDKPKLSDLEKQVFKEANWRRREAGIRLKRFCVMCDEHQVVSLNNYWNGFVEELGKQGAVDYLLVALRRADWELREVLRKREQISHTKNAMDK